MSRAQALVDHATARALLAAGMARFARHGYQAASVRAIAADAGITATAFYAHFPSKLALLRELAQTTYAAGVAQTEAAVRSAGADATERLDAAIWAQCDFAIRHRRQIQVIDSERVNLADEDRERLLAAKERFAQIIGEILDEGAEAGAFDVDRPGTTSRAVATMCASISSWYAGAGAESPRQIAETYCELVSRMAGVGTGAGRRLVAVPELQIA